MIMNKINRINRVLDRFLTKVSGESKENYVLLSIERSSVYKEAEEEIRKAFILQASELFRRDSFKEKIEKRLRFKKVSGDLSEDNEIFDEEESFNSAKESIDEEKKPLNSYLKGGLLVGFYMYLANRGGQSFLDKAGINETFNLTDTGIIEQFVSKADALILQLERTTSDKLARIITEGRKDGLSYNKMANIVRKEIPETYKNRAKAIVRTETAELVNDTEMRAARMNHAQEKIWVAAGPNICDICLGNDEVRAGLDAYFPSGDIRPPAHPNCKCLLDYVFPPVGDSVAWTGGDSIQKDKVNADLDRLYHRAKGAKIEVDKIADEVSLSGKGSFVLKAPLKGRGRAVQKAIKEEGGNAFALTDIARNTVVAKNPKQAIEMYRKASIGKNVVRANYQNTDLGYVGGMLKIKTKTGHIAEMQIVTPKMLYAKEASADKILPKELYNKIKKETGLPHGKLHKYYEEWRVEENIDKWKKIEKISVEYAINFKD